MTKRLVPWLGGANRTLGVLVALWMGGSGLCGCGDDGGDSGADATQQSDAGISINAFTGTWVASMYRYTNNANESETFDVIDDGGEFRMTVLSGGRARTFLTIGAVEDEWDAQLTIAGTTLTSTPVETTRRTRVYEFTLDGDALTLTDSDDAFDFTQSGADPVAATVYVELTRN